VTYTSIIKPMTPFTMTFHSIARGSSFEALLSSSAMCAGASPPTKAPTFVIMPTRHARPARDYSSTRHYRSEDSLLTASPPSVHKRIPHLITRRPWCKYPQRNHNPNPGYNVKDQNQDLDQRQIFCHKYVEECNDESDQHGDQSSMIPLIVIARVVEDQHSLNNGA
jgi:hypothetical protein